MGVITPNKYYIGPIRNFGVLSQYGYAITEIIKDRYRHYVNPTNVHYAEHLGGIILKPDPSLYPMSKTIHTISGDVDICTPPKQGVQYLFGYNATSNSTSITSQYNLPATPSLTISLLRAAAPDGMDKADQQFTFAFGGRYTLEWGGVQNPRLLDGATELEQLDIKDSWRREAEDNEEQRIEILNFSGKLYIVFSGNDPWVISDIGDVNAAPFTFSANGGVYALNVSRYRFATSGTFKTGYIEHFFTYDDGDLQQQVFPAVQSGCTATVSVDATVDTTKQYTMTLTGPGTTSPLIQLFSYEYDPEFAEATPAWTEITHWVKDAKESKNLDVGSDGCSVTLDLLHEHNGQTLTEALGELKGQYAFYYTTGTPAGEEVRRFTGVLKRRAATNTDMAQTIEYKALDKFAILKDAKLRFAPVAIGANISDAMNRYANWGGVPDGDIDTSDVTGTLDDPGDGYDNPPWLPANGTSTAEWLESLRSATGKVLYFDEHGTLTVQDAWSNDVVAHYDTVAGTANGVAISTIEADTDLQGAENHVIVEGRDSEGTPIIAGRWDYDSIFTEGTDRYLGYGATKWIVNTDLTTVDAVTEACIAAYKERKAGQKVVKITSNHPESSLCYRKPGEIIEVNDTVTGVSEYYRIQSISTEMEPFRNLATVTAEEWLNEVVV